MEKDSKDSFKSERLIQTDQKKVEQSNKIAENPPLRLSSAFQELTVWVDENKRILSNAFYAIGLLGVITILHSVRGVSKTLLFNS